MLKFTSAFKTTARKLLADQFIDEMCDYLVDDCEVAEQSDELRHLCRMAYLRGLELGLTQKSSLLMFGWLVHVTDGQALASLEVEKALIASETDPDWAMDQIIKTAGLMAQTGA